MFRYGQDNTNLKSKQQFISQLQEVFIKYGTDILYIPRIEVDETLTGGNYLDMLYDTGIEIVARFQGSENFGESNFFSKFGYSSNEEDGTVYQTIQYFTSLGITPEIGDLIYIKSMNKKLFEITNNTYESTQNKYIFGSDSMVYELKMKLHNVDLISTYATGNADIDSQNNESDETDARYNNEVTQKIIDSNIIDNSETNPLNVE